MRERDRMAMAWLATTGEQAGLVVISVRCGFHTYLFSYTVAPVLSEVSPSGWFVKNDFVITISALADQTLSSCLNVIIFLQCTFANISR